MVLPLHRRLKTQATLVLALVASIIAWLPLVLAGDMPTFATMTPVPDQRADIQVGADLAAERGGSIRQLSAPFFNALCDTETGLWAQTITAGMTARLSEIDLLLLRRSPDITSPVAVEVRAVDRTGRPTETVLARGLATATIPFHHSQPGRLTVPLDAPAPLLRGRRTAIFPTSTPSPSGACYEWPSSGLDVYAGGALAVTYDLGGSFALGNGDDAAFRTWMR